MRPTSRAGAKTTNQSKRTNKKRLRQGSTFQEWDTFLVAAGTQKNTKLKRVELSYRHGTDETDENMSGITSGSNSVTDELQPDLAEFLSALHRQENADLRPPLDKRHPAAPSFARAPLLTALLIQGAGGGGWVCHDTCWCTVAYTYT